MPFTLPGRAADGVPGPRLLTDLTARDRNPQIIARALQASLHEAVDRAGVRRYIPGVLIGLGGFALLAASPVLGTMVLAATAAWMGRETMRSRKNTLPAIAAQFKAAAARLPDPTTLRPAVRVLDEAIAATETLRDDFNPRRHPFRTTTSVAIIAYGAAMALPGTVALGAFFMTAAMLDTHSDHLQDTRKKVAESLQHLRP